MKILIQDYIILLKPYNTLFKNFNSYLYNIIKKNSIIVFKYTLTLYYFNFAFLTHIFDALVIVL